MRWRRSLRFCRPFRSRLVGKGKGTTVQRVISRALRCLAFPFESRVPSSLFLCFHLSLPPRTSPHLAFPRLVRPGPDLEAKVSHRHHLVLCPRHRVEDSGGEADCHNIFQKTKFKTLVNDLTSNFNTNTLYKGSWCNLVKAQQFGPPRRCRLWASPHPFTPTSLNRSPLSLLVPSHPPLSSESVEDERREERRGE